MKHFYKSTNPICELSTSATLSPPKCLHLLISSPLIVKILTYEFWGDTSSHAIALRIFYIMFMRDSALQFSFLIIFLAGVSIKVMEGSQNKLRSTVSPNPIYFLQEIIWYLYYFFVNSWQNSPLKPPRVEFSKIWKALNYKSNFLFLPKS